MILSDFDIEDPEAQKHDLERFVEYFRRHRFDFDEVLALVHLPDISKADPQVARPSLEVFFETLRKHYGVQKIVRLVVRDHPTQPVYDWYISEVVRDFAVEVLDWMKCDLDVRFLLPPQDEDDAPEKVEVQAVTRKKPKNPVVLRKIHLYSSGHWGPLHHWTGADGLVLIPTVSSTPS